MDEIGAPSGGFDIVVFGLGRYGNHLFQELTESGQKVLGVDCDPAVVQRLAKPNGKVVYGDAEDPECALTLPLLHAKWVVSSVPQLSVNVSLLQTLERIAFTGQTATTAHNKRDAAFLSDAGSSLVLLPYSDAAIEAARELRRRVESSCTEALGSDEPPPRAINGHLP